MIHVMPSRDAIVHEIVANIGGLRPSHPPQKTKSLRLKTPQGPLSRICGATLHRRMAKLIARELRAKHPTFMSDTTTKMSGLEWTRT